MNTDQSTIINAVLKRLITEVAELNESNCVIPEDDDSPQIPRQSSILVAVSPMGGQFDDGWFEGGAADQCHEHSGVLVTVWSQIKLDTPGRRTSAMLEINRGLMPWKKKILKALAGHRLLDDNGNELLTELMAPRDSRFPRRSSDGECVGVAISFATDFLWDLT